MRALWMSHNSRGCRQRNPTNRGSRRADARCRVGLQFFFFLSLTVQSILNTQILFCHWNVKRWAFHPAVFKVKNLPRLNGHHVPPTMRSARRVIFRSIASSTSNKSISTLSSSKPRGAQRRVLDRRFSGSKVCVERSCSNIFGFNEGYY